jgi:asparagine synthase (glutamine-hydrolysing)
VCGVCGVWARNHRVATDEATVVAMRDTMRHRGPDDAGAWSDPSAGIALGHRRLSIVDLSRAGHQPMANEDGTVWITYNGEVYNHEALRGDLEQRGHRYRSRTDSETLVHLYEEEGPAMLGRLEGMFAFAIWDGRRRQLMLARDRLGVKPLYYSDTPDGFLFASEVKAILAHPHVRPELDVSALHDYLTFGFVPPPRTIYRGISKLAPAERLIVDSDGRVDRHRWWRPLSLAAVQEARDLSEEEAVTRVRDLLRESIAKRMMSDVPFGVFLSGGLDSSANVALMTELAAGPVRTFSTAPRGHSRYDELSHARLVARRFGTEHHEVTIDSDDMREFLPRLAQQQDEPTSEWTAVPQHFVTKLARESGTIVVQCGEGSDELFHGYDGYAFHRRFAVPFQRLPRTLRRPVAVAASRLTRRAGRGVRHGEALYDAAHSSIPYWGGALTFRGEGKAALLGSPNGHRSFSLPERHWQDAGELLPSADVFQRMTYVELQQRLPELLLMRLDKVCMASSVEGREPFLDHHLVEFALAMPPSLKYRDGTGKWALRRAMRGILPDEIIDRPKQGFGTPMEEWLRGPFGVEAQRAVDSSSLREQGVFDYGEVHRLFAAHRAGRGDWSKHLWNLYTVSVWHDRWIAGAD